MNELAKHYRLLVAFDTKRESGREWLIEESAFNFSWIVTRAIEISGLRLSGGFERARLQIPVNTLAILQRFKPDIVVSGELGIRTMWAALYCRIRRRPLIIWWEGDLRSGRIGRLRTLRHVSLLRQSSRVWGNGVVSARTLARDGISRDRVDLGMMSMDTFSWRIAVDQQRDSVRAEVRVEYALQGAVLLFVGGLIRRKGVLEMLSALTVLADIGDLPPWSMLWIGAGPLYKEVDRWAASNPEFAIARIGFVQPADLPRYYAASDIFVMPSLGDVWGLVCLEALVAGLPQVTSMMAGAASDLITSRDIGDIIDPRNAQAFAQRIADRIRQAPALVPSGARDEASTTWSPFASAIRGMTSIARCLESDRDKYPSS